jgi:hypothetical protein
MTAQNDYGGNGQLPLVPGDDGVTDAANDAAERIFGGRPILKYADRQYMLGKDRDEVPLATKKIFRSTTHYWQLWLPDPDDDDKSKLDKVVKRQPGHRLPERDELEPAYDDKSQWRLYKGEPQDPWQNTRAILFEDPETHEQCVFVTPTGGGHSAVMDLCGEIQRKRQVHSDACPIIELRWANMPTQWGMKTKPLFKIVQWLTADNVPIVERTIPAREAKKIVDQHEIDDGIPF